MTLLDHLSFVRSGALVLVLGVLQLGASATEAATPGMIGGGGLIAVAALFLALEHRRAKRLDERTERFLDHLEWLAGIDSRGDEGDPDT